PGEFSSQIHSHLVFCPASRKIQDRFPGGELTLRGVEAGNRGEIARILRNEEARAREKNPLERIMCMDAANGRWRVEATTEKLAQRLGRSLRRQGVESSVTSGGIIISLSVWCGKSAEPAGWKRMKDASNLIRRRFQMLDPIQGVPLHGKKGDREKMMGYMA
ncbi:MAG TPA: hypothetical protein VGA01_12300, partial [Candidatus Binatia bacterium]